MTDRLGNNISAVGAHGKLDEREQGDSGGVRDRGVISANRIEVMVLERRGSIQLAVQE